ncbi:hypothetical protein BHE74_00047034 [Ensete ventricosum]|nr:hypothetical protein BHE74_00047034 [Ensete ventricosum]
MTNQDNQDLTPANPAASDILAVSHLVFFRRCPDVFSASFPIPSKNLIANSDEIDRTIGFLSWRNRMEKGIIDLFEGIGPLKSLRGDLLVIDEGGCGRWQQRGEEDGRMGAAAVEEDGDGDNNDIGSDVLRQQEAEAALLYADGEEEGEGGSSKAEEATGKQRQQGRVASSGDAVVREQAVVVDLGWSRGRGSNDDKDGKGEGCGSRVAAAIVGDGRDGWR